jgi:hypothetical protein
MNKCSTFSCDKINKICKNCQSHSFCFVVVSQEEKPEEKEPKKWCGNCEYSKRTEEQYTKNCIKVKIKCNFLLPVWASIDEIDSSEEDKRTLEFFKDYEFNYDDYGSDCLCHKFKGD